MATNLLSLPIDILSLLPYYIHNIEDFNSFISTCRDLRILTSIASPQQILHLASKSAPIFFHPHPHFLIAATIHSVTSQVGPDPALPSALIGAFRNGIDGLYGHCLAHGSLTLAGIRHWHTLRYSTLNPLVNAIDEMAGPKWFATPDYWDGGVSEASTLNTDPNRAAYQLVIYAEAFGRDAFDTFLSPGLESNRPAMNLNTRFEFLKYCVPDMYCDKGFPGFEVLKTGPYMRLRGPFMEVAEPPRDWSTYSDQIDLFHVLRCQRWSRLWQGIVEEAGGHFVNEDTDTEEQIGVEWRQQQQQLGDEHGQQDQRLHSADTELEQHDDVIEPLPSPAVGNQGEDEDDENDAVENDDDDDDDDNNDDDDDDDYNPIDRTLSDDQIPPLTLEIVSQSWREDLLLNALMFSAGVDGFMTLMEYVKTGKLADKDKHRLREIRQKISELDEDDRPAVRKIGKYLMRPCSEYPDPRTELSVCCAKRYSGPAQYRWFFSEH